MAAAGELRGKGVLGDCWEMGKQRQWKQLQLLKTGELGWGVPASWSCPLLPDPPTHQHPSQLHLCLRKQMDFP